MRQYLTYRPVLMGSEYLTIGRVLDHSFNGLSIRHNTETWLTPDEGRVLAWFEVDDDPNPAIMEDKRLVILEALQLFGAHAKTLDKARAFLSAVTGRTDITIEGDRLVIPDEPLAVS